MIKLRKKVLAFVLAAATFTLSVSSAVDKRFYKRIAEEVWNTPDSIFDPSTVIPDSLSRNNSAVIIAWADDYKIDHLVKSTSFNSPQSDVGMTNRLIKKNVERKMIKLIDQKAIEDNSEYEFGRNNDIVVDGRRWLYELKSAFGARIHKPDGRIVEVDLSDAIEIGKGKKGKEDKHYKIAVPGLEPGDVLDYFFFEDEMIESDNLKPENVEMCSEYPILNRRLTVSTNPLMTVEYKCYNGVPDLVHDKLDRNYQRATLTLQNIPGVNFNKYSFPYRQIPFVRLHFINNTDKVVTRNSRRGGLHGNVPTEKIIAEIADILKIVNSDSPVQGKAGKLVKDVFIKNNPDAIKKEVADAAWLAVNYYDRIGESVKDRTSDYFERAVVFNDVLKNLKLYSPDSLSFGIINPRNEVSVFELSAYNEPYFVVKTPDALYYMPMDNTLSPGEIPGIYKGETAIIYPGERKKLGKGTVLGQYAVPGKRVTENSALFQDTVTIGKDDVLNFTSSMTFTGGVKNGLEELTDTLEWVNEVENFFDMPSELRYKERRIDRIGRNNDLKQLLKIYGKNFYGAEPDSVIEAKVLSRGILPDDSAMKVEARSEFSGLVEHLGEDLSLKIGQLTGMPNLLTDNERNRILDVMLPFVSQETHILLVKAPEGYAFDEASVESLKRQVNEPVGQFIATSRITDDGDLQLTTSVRYKFANVPLDYWPSFMKLVDEASSFGDASVILVKK